MSIYTIDLGFDKFRFAANLAQASATIYLVDGEGEESPTQYQTADACHDVHEAAKLALSMCGRDYYAEPDDDRDDDEILADLIDDEEICADEIREEEEWV